MRHIKPVKSKWLLLFFILVSLTSCEWDTDTFIYTYNGTEQGPMITDPVLSAVYVYSGTGSTYYLPSSTKPTNPGTYSVYVSGLYSEPPPPFVDGPGRNVPYSETRAFSIINSTSLTLDLPNATLTSSCAGVPSTSTTFGVSGSGISSTVTVSAPTGFEISEFPMTSYSSSLSLTPVSNTVTSTLYIRLLSGAANNVSGTITALATTTGESSISSTTTVSSTIVSAPSFTGGSTYNLCTDATYLISLTVANSYNGWSTSSSTITVNNGYVTAGTATGNYTVSYTDGCAQTVSASITVNNSNNGVTAIADGLTSYKINNTNPIPQGPTASLYVGYNGFNYYNATKPTKPGFYRANNVSGNSAGCPFPFEIFRCTTCPD
jgi:hypothetical protein